MVFKVICVITLIELTKIDKDAYTDDEILMIGILYRFDKMRYGELGKYMIYRVDEEFTLLFL